MTSWLILIRWKNLSIILIFQVLVFMFLVSPLLANGKASIQQWTELFIISITTLLVAASGYVINDLADLPIDRINRDPAFVPLDRAISPDEAKIAYLACLILGNFFALAFCIKSHFFWHYWIFPISVLALYFYSAYLKCTPLAGNILVAGFTAGAVYLPFYAFKSQMEVHLPQAEGLSDLIQQLTLFAFLSNLLREWIKDREDYTGDQINRCQSTAVFLGKQKSWYLIGLGFLMNLFFCLGCMAGLPTRFLFVLFGLLILLPLLVIMILFLGLGRESRFNLISNLLKLWMLSGFTFYLIHAYDP